MGRWVKKRVWNDCRWRLWLIWPAVMAMGAIGSEILEHLLGEENYWRLAPFLAGMIVGGWRWNEANEVWAAYMAGIVDPYGNKRRSPA